MKLEIRMYGDAVLHEKARPIERVTDEVRRFVDDMAETMYAANGLGLAANQVGDLRRVLVIDVTDADEPREQRRKTTEREHNLEAYLNAEILESSTEDGSYSEGCLSIPGIEGDVYRPLRIRMRWMDLDGNAHDEWLDGMRARVLQHEVDHLDGVLFVDRLGAVKRRLLAGKLNRLKQETKKRLEEPAGSEKG